MKYIAPFKVIAGIILFLIAIAIFALPSLVRKAKRINKLEDD